MKNIDKILHFLVGFIVFMVVNSLCHNNKITFLCVIVLALLKEVYDMYHRNNHTLDGMDVLCTIFGFNTAYIVLQ
jgi:hypothetical protein